MKFGSIDARKQKPPLINEIPPLSVFDTTGNPPHYWLQALERVGRHWEPLETLLSLPFLLRNTNILQPIPKNKSQCLTSEAVKTQEWVATRVSQVSHKCSTLALYNSSLPFQLRFDQTLSQVLCTFNVNWIEHLQCASLYSSLVKKQFISKASTPLQLNPGIAGQAAQFSYSFPIKQQYNLRYKSKKKSWDFKHKA